MYLDISSPAQVVGELWAAADANALWLLCVADCHGNQKFQACSRRAERRPCASAAGCSPA